MDKKKLGRLRKVHSGLRAKIGSIRSRDLVSLAKKLGRRRSKRGREPTYVSDDFPDARPISIPSHPGNMKRGTANSILDDLEGDIFRWEEHLDEEDSDTRGPHE